MMMKLLVDKFLCVETKICMSPIGIGIAREEPVSGNGLVVLTLKL